MATRSVARVRPPARLRVRLSILYLEQRAAEARPWQTPAIGKAVPTLTFLRANQDR